MSVGSRMSWSSIPLNKVAAPKKHALNGGPFGSKLVSRDYTPDGVPVIRGVNLPGHSRFSSEGFVFVSEAKADELLPNNAHPGDLVFTQRGTLGQIGLIPKDCGYERFVISQSQMKLTVDESEALAEYVYYYFRDPTTIQRIHNLGFSSGVPHINLDVLRKFEIALPPLTTQRKIASILSAYDDLIENNTRRIEILEEMAQRIYQEWFVNFRFPGHEKVKMVESELGSIPEGWEVKRLGEVLSALESGKRPKGGVNTSDNDVPSIGAENIIGLGKYDYSKEKYISQSFFDLMKRGRIQDKDVLLYKDGAHIGKKSMFRDNFPHAVCCVNEHVFILRTNELCTPSYLYLWLDQPKMTENIRNLNANAAQPGINQKGVKGLPILIPRSDLLGVFDSIVEPLLAEVFNLAKKNNVLRRTRDLLLPKLISGEVSVEDLDVDPEEVSEAEAVK